MVALVLAVGLGLMGVGRIVWTVPAVALASTLPHAIIIWDGNDTGIGRHALFLAMTLRLGLILLTLYLVEGVLREQCARRAARRHA